MLWLPKIKGGQLPWALLPLPNGTPSVAPFVEWDKNDTLPESGRISPGLTPVHSQSCPFSSLYTNNICMCLSSTCGSATEFAFAPTDAFGY